MYRVFTRMPGESYCRRFGRVFVVDGVWVTFLERFLTHIFVDSARALWASFCFILGRRSLLLCLCDVLLELINTLVC